MATNIKSVQELYNLGKNEIQNQDASLTDFNEGSLLDIITGVMSTMASESQRITLDSFAKTFVETANGPEVTLGTDDLQRLLVDHFGDQFARPVATVASGVVTFSRPTTGAGNVTILAGTVVKTVADATGTVQRFATVATVVMTGLSINASVTAVLAGSAGNVSAGAISLVETTLADLSIVVTNAAVLSAGTDGADDSVYREFARNLLTSLRGATLAAIAAKALTVAGVVQAVPVEQIQTVIQYSPATGATSGSAFKISRNYLYIADANGTASAVLVAAVSAAIDTVRAGGIKVNVVAASAVVQNVTVSLTLNASGPNFAALSADISPILNDIASYIQSLPVGSGFVRANCKAAILALWGAAGSNDLTAMTFVSPGADTSVTATQTLIPGTIASA